MEQAYNEFEDEDKLFILNTVYTTLNCLSPDATKEDTKRTLVAGNFKFFLEDEDQPSVQFSSYQEGQRFMNMLDRVHIQPIL